LLFFIQKLNYEFSSRRSMIIVDVKLLARAAVKREETSEPPIALSAVLLNLRGILLRSRPKEIASERRHSHTKKIPLD
jgi:hypothetical protein